MDRETDEVPDVYERKTQAEFRVVAESTRYLDALRTQRIDRSLLMPSYEAAQIALWTLLRAPLGLDRATRQTAVLDLQDFLMMVRGAPAVAACETCSFAQLLTRIAGCGGHKRRPS